MAWKDFMKMKDNRRKNPEDLFSEPFICKFTKKQIAFLKERSKIESNSVSGIIRRSVNQYITDLDDN